MPAASKLGIASGTVTRQAPTKRAMLPNTQMHCPPDKECEPGCAACYAESGSESGIQNAPNLRRRWPHRRRGATRRTSMTDRQPTGAHAPYPSEVAAGGVVLTLTPDQVYVEFAPTATPEEVSGLLTRYR